VQSWFLARRSRASGIATAGLGVGTLILPLGAGQLLPYVGWRGCLIGIAIVIAVTGLPAAFLLRKREEGHPKPQSDGSASPPPTPRAAWATRKFPLYYVAMALASVSTFIPYVHIVPSARDLGVSLPASTALIGIIGVGNIFGRFVLAGLGDRIGRIRLLAGLTLAVAGSFVLWATATGFVQLAIFAGLFGMSYGGTVGLYPAVAADLFGTRHIGAMIGYLYTSVGFAALVGPSLAGWTFDLTGSYQGPIVVSACISIVAAGLSFQLGREDGNRSC
jgi:MFS family permease